MITTKVEALALCKKYEVNLKDHDTVIVTGNGNIYLSDNIDPKDLGEVFYLKGKTISIDQIPEAPTDTPPEKTADELALEKEIADEEMTKLLVAQTATDDSKKAK